MQGRLFSKCTYKVQHKARDHGFMHMEGVTQSCKNVRLTTALHEPLCINTIHCVQCAFSTINVYLSQEKKKNHSNDGATPDHLNFKTFTTLAKILKRKSQR